MTVHLPNTTLTLSMEEADSLNCILQTDLLHGLFYEMDGQEVSDAILVADASISRSEAWDLHRSLENIIDPDDEPVVDASSHDRVNWLESGF